MSPELQIAATIILIGVCVVLGMAWIAVVITAASERHQEVKDFDRIQRQRERIIASQRKRHESNK